MNTGRVLVASCGAKRRNELRSLLELEGYEVIEAARSEQAIAEVSLGRHHLLLLDSGLDANEPYELCRVIRAKSEVGIIILNQDATGQGRIDALNSGADDCVAESCAIPELLARVRALLRRIFLTRDERYQIFLHDRAIDLKAHKIKGPIGRVENLTPKEFLVLECLVAQPNKPLAHRNLARAVWQRDGRGEVEYLRIVIKQLRRKLEPDPARPRYILTEHSFGYRFQMHARESQPILC